MKKATVKNGLKIALVAGATVALIPTVYGQGIGLTNLERMLVPTPQSLERGAEIYEAQCSSCHGANGQGGAEAGGFTGDASLTYSGVNSIYSVIAYGQEVDGSFPTGEGEAPQDTHPIFNGLQYQDKWAVSHYVHSLIENPQPDSPAIIEQVRQEYEFGICNPEIRAGITKYLEPEGPEQLALGKQEYDIQCASCHGAEGLGDGPAGAVINARNFTDEPADWVNGSSPLGIFNTLQTGIEGTGMASYAHLPEETRWALVHYIRQEFVPEENLSEVTEEQIVAACSALSAPPRPPSIPIERAMEFLARDAENIRYIQRSQYGAPMVAADADPIAGQEAFAQNCASCHGADGQGVAALGPFGTFPPYFFVETSPLVPASVGGTYRDVANRGIAGPHATLPDMPSLTSLSDADWKNIQSYIAQFQGQGRDEVQVVSADQPQEEAENGEILEEEQDTEAINEETETPEE